MNLVELLVHLIAKELFRMWEGIYEMVVGCVCGLVRLRVQCV